LTGAATSRRHRRRNMLDQQLDLFSDSRPVVDRALIPKGARRFVAADLDDAALIAALPESSLADSAVLAAEAARRRLAAAVPALATLCRRFAGFGTARRVPEQIAALDALAIIGGQEAAQSVAELVEHAVVQGPTLATAVRAARRLRSRLSVETLQRLLRHGDPNVRADACRCARPAPELISVMVELLDDLHDMVSRSAALALGQMGRSEARPRLKQLLRDAPSEDAIDAVSFIADEECLVLLGRVARSHPGLARAAIDTLENVDQPRAQAIVGAIRASPKPQSPT